MLKKIVKKRNFKFEIIMGMEAWGNGLTGERNVLRNYYKLHQRQSYSYFRLFIPGILNSIR